MSATRIGYGLWQPIRPPADNPKRGKSYGGPCKHRFCQAHGATHWNSADQAFFCEACAERINANAFREEGAPPVCIDQALLRRRG